MCKCGADVFQVLMFVVCHGVWFYLSTVLRRFGDPIDRLTLIEMVMRYNIAVIHKVSIGKYPYWSSNYCFDVWVI